MDQSRVERAQYGFANNGAVVAQGVHRDPGDEVEVARAVLGDELGPFAGDEDRSDARVDAQQCCGVCGSQRQCHAG